MIPHFLRDVRPPRFVSVSVVLVVGISLLVLTAGIVAGATDDTGRFQSGALQSQESDQICGQQPAPLITFYNNHIEEIPWFFELAVQDRTVHLIVRNDTQEDYTFLTGSDGFVQSYESGIPASPSIRVITSCESFLSIQSADDPVSEFWSEYRNDRVKIVGVGFFSWLLVEMLKNPVVAGGGSLLLLILLAAALVYYYLRRRRMVQEEHVYEDEDPE